MKKIWMLVLLLASLGASEGAAQEPALVPGARVRIMQATSPSASAGTQRRASHIGSVEAVDSSSITLKINGRSLIYPRDIIERVDVSQGRASAGRGALRGAKRGAVVGASATAALIAMIEVTRRPCDECPDGEPMDSRHVFYWLFLGFEGTGGHPELMVRGTLSGALMGAAVGSITREIWVPVWPRAESLSLSVDPAPSGGTSVGFSIRF